jgi:cytochrome c551/c552
MKMQKPLLSSILVCLLGAPLVSQGADADWKRGRVYYRMVCTACHVEKASAIAPSTKTMAEWNAYLLADKHAKGKDSVKYYLSKKYRDSVKATNKAAEKYADVSEQDLFEDLKAFVIKGAKDGDSPASCS